MKSYLHTVLPQLWYQQKQHWLALFTWPLSWLYRGLVRLHKYLYRCGFKKVQTLPIPVIVVGNITVGGNGKTPLVIALAEHLQNRNIRVGILSRGYGANCTHFPHAVALHDTASLVGDEPLLIKHRLDCPVIIDPNRARGGQVLAQQVDVIIMDDGLQHHALHRDIEICVLDQRGVGNGAMLPHGPLREAPTRLSELDFVIGNGVADYAHNMTLVATNILSLDGRKSLPLNHEHFTHALVGIGNPARFWQTLAELSVTVSNKHIFADHYAYRQADLPSGRVIMTEKDAVKCRHLACENAYYVKINALLDEQFYHQFDEKLTHVLKEKGHAIK